MAESQKISEKELDELCELAHLHLDPAEKKQIACQLTAVIEVLGQIDQIDTSEVEPVVHPAALPVCFRDDRVEPSLRPEQVFKNTAHRRDSYFRVPRITGDGAGEK